MELDLAFINGEELRKQPNGPDDYALVPGFRTRNGQEGEATGHGSCNSGRCRDNKTRLMLDSRGRQQPQ